MRISIIVPVYNVEKYLDRTMASIIAQKYTDYEVILVDDGSTDKSGEMCDEYARKYNNIHVIHQKNSGPSAARNKGILESTGGYLTYIDSDDIVTPDYLSTLAEMITKYDADVSCARFALFSDEEDFGNVNDKGTERKERVYAGKDACIALMYEKDFYTSTCNLLARRDIAEKNLFPEGRYHEDDMTTFRYLYSAERVVSCNVVLYYYYQRQGSIMHCYGQPVLDEIKAADYYAEYCRDMGESFRKAAEHRKFSLIRSTLENYPELKEKNPDVYSNSVNYLKKSSLGIIMDNCATKGNRLFALKMMTGLSRL